MGKLKPLIIVGGLLVVIISVLSIFAYRNTHWWKKDDKDIKKAGMEEKQVVLSNGRTINYGESDSGKPALLLIHGQMVSWENYGEVLPELTKKWHVYAVDVYGHGGSSHDEELYYLDVNGDDLIWFINEVIGEKTIVCGHSNGAITAAYMASQEPDMISGLLLEDPPVFSTDGEGWEESFAYLDTYKVLHEYLQSDQEECWEAYYLRHCYWGQLFMPDAMEGIANYAKSYNEKHPDKEVAIFFLPKSMTTVFHYTRDYDLRYGDRFYDLSWNHNISHEEILKGIEVPTVPDIEKCFKPANFYGTTIDDLYHFKHDLSGLALPPGPKGKHIFGKVIVDESMRIKLPKMACDMFLLKSGDSMVVLADENEGLALIKTETFERKMKQMMELGNKVFE